MIVRALMCWIVALPLAAQAWDVRVEVPFAGGQDLPLTQLQDRVVSGDLDTGRGAILTVNHRIIRMGPILKFEWGLEFAHIVTDGRLQQQTTTLEQSPTSLKQSGVGAGLNAQFSVPFVGLAADIGLIQRFHRYHYEAAGITQNHHLSRTWLRVGARWKLPVPELRLYVTGSYQAPFSKDRPVRVNSESNLIGFLNAQGSGQEFQRVWTLGVGTQF